jgi:Superfamily I DNA and RNA helicases
MVYVGDQHQQIYEWRGAVNAMATIATDDAKKLTQSFRFGPAIAAAATLILSKLGEKSRLTGNQRISSQILDTTEVDAVLARTNATVIAEALTTKESGRKPFIVGGTQDLERLVSDVFSLQDGVPGSHPDFFGFSNWNDVVAFASTDEGEDLRTFVTLVESNGPKRLWAAIKSSVSDIESADVCLSTAHKAKGAEWRSVRIADDFSANSSDGEPISESEARLFYVAITRAKEILSISPTLLSAFTQAPRFVSDSEAAEARLRSRAQTVSSAPPQPTRTRTSAPAVAGAAVAGKVAMRVTAPNSVVRPPPPSPEVTRSIVARPNPDEMITASAPTTKRKRGVLSTLFGAGSRNK